jgi:hypothetical protein
MHIQPISLKICTAMHTGSHVKCPVLLSYFRRGSRQQTFGKYYNIKFPENSFQNFEDCSITTGIQTKMVKFTAAFLQLVTENMPENFYL